VNPSSSSENQEIKIAQTETHEVARGAFINLIGNLGKLSHFAFDIIAARILGQDTYGYFSTTWFAMHLSFIICYFGAHRLVIDFVARNKNEKEEIYYRGIFGYIMLSFLLSALLVLAVYLFADDLAAAMDKPPVAEYMKIMVWCAPFYAATTILLSATRSLKIMKFWVFVRNGFEPLADLILLCIVFFAFGLLGAPFYAKAITFTLGAGISVYYFQKHFSFVNIFRSFPDASTWKRIFSFGFPVMCADFISIVILKVDLIPLSFLVPTAQVAVFQVILNTGNVMRNIPQAIDPIMMPIVVDMNRRKEFHALEHIYTTIIRSSLFLSFGLFVLITIYGDFILRIFSNDFVYATPAIILTCFGISLHTVFSNIEPVLVMSGFPYLNLFNNIFLVVINLTLDFFLIPSYGIMGAAWGSMIACVTTSLLQIGELHFFLKLKPLRWDLLNILWIGAIFFLLFKGIEIGFSPISDYIVFDIISIGLFAAAYLFVGWKWFLHDEERSMFAAIVKRN